MEMRELGLFQNSTSQDVKDEFEELYNAGKRVQDITDSLIENFSGTLSDIDEEPLFWLALANTQWNLGVLQPDVKEKALYWIDKGSAILINQPLAMSVNVERNNALGALRAKLLSSQPPTKKAAKKRIYKCQWTIGDVFAYKLESDLAKERNLYGRFFLIQKVDESVWYPGHIVPIVYVKITPNTNLPSSVEEYNQLEYVQTWFTKYEDRFLPIDMRRPQEDIAEKAQKDYQVDDYGFLPQYRVILLNTSKRVIPSNLIYVGNFANAVCPQKEFIPHTKENIVTASWKQFDESFETKMIKRYCGHNLRQLSMYGNRKE